MDGPTSFTFSERTATPGRAGESSQDYASLAREYDRLYERLVAAERTQELLRAVDAHDLMERPARVMRKLVELSYGQGQISVRIESRRKLAVLVGFGESKMGEALDELVAAQMLQIYPDSKLYEPLPNQEKWRARPRCRFGLDGAAELQAEIVADDQRRRGEQIEFAEQEKSFVPDTTIKQAMGEVAREEAGFEPVDSDSGAAPFTPGNHPAHSVPSPRADAHESHAGPHPSAIIGAATAAGPTRLSEMVRQALGRAGHPKLPGKGSSVPESGKSPAPKLPGKGSSQPDANQKLPGKGSSGTGATPAIRQELPGKGSFPNGDSPKLPGKGSFQPQNPPPGAQNFPEREVSSRTRASDHHQSSSVSSVSSPNQQLSSDDHPDDEPEADERGGDGGGEGLMMVPVHDEVFGDIRRKLGEEGMLSFSTFWRAAIFASRSAAIHALDQVKYADRRIPGGYMRRCFYTECAQRGIQLRHPELVRGIPRELRGLRAIHP